MELYTLAGEFVSATEFTATFTANFTGTSCGLTDCSSQSWNITGTRPMPPCCSGSAGNVDCDPENGTDISDLSRLIDFLYILFDPLCCEPSANLDGQMGTDISDLSALIDYLYISFTPPANCQ